MGILPDGDFRVGCPVNIYWYPWIVHHQEFSSFVFLFFLSSNKHIHRVCVWNWWTLWVFVWPLSILTGSIPLAIRIILFLLIYVWSIAIDWPIGWKKKRIVTTTILLRDQETLVRFTEWSDWIIRAIGLVLRINTRLNWTRARPQHTERWHEEPATSYILSSLFCGKISHCLCVCVCWR